MDQGQIRTAGIPGYRQADIPDREEEWHAIQTWERRQQIHGQVLYIGRGEK